MSSAPTKPDTTVQAAPREIPRESRRLRMKPDVEATGWVDGAWWPRSRDLTVELPALLAELPDRLGRVERVSYHLGDWDPGASRIVCNGAVVRLSGYRTQRASTVNVLGNRQRATLLVVAPEASGSGADAALMAAAQRGNTDDVEALLGSGPRMADVDGD